MREEIVAGLQNAVARGQTLEQAAQSFINAGYNPQEVKAAYQMLSSGATSVFTNANSPPGQGIQIQQNNRQAIGNYGPPKQYPAQSQATPQQVPPLMQQTVPTAPPINLPEKKKGGREGLLITMIIVSALILLASLGYLAYVLLNK